MKSRAVPERISVASLGNPGVRAAGTWGVAVVTGELEDQLKKVMLGEREEFEIAGPGLMVLFKTPRAVTSQGMAHVQVNYWYPWVGGACVLQRAVSVMTMMNVDVRGEGPHTFLGLMREGEYAAPTDFLEPDHVVLSTLHGNPQEWLTKPPEYEAKKVSGRQRQLLLESLRPALLAVGAKLGSDWKPGEGVWQLREEEVLELLRLPR